MMMAATMTMRYYGDGGGDDDDKNQHLCISMNVLLTFRKKETSLQIPT